MSNLCEPNLNPLFCDHIWLIDRDNFYHQSLSDLYGVFIDEIDLQKKLILSIAYASKLFSKAYIVPAEIIVVATAYEFINEKNFPDMLEGWSLINGDEFGIPWSDGAIAYRVIGITPSTQKTIVTADTVFSVRFANNPDTVNLEY